MHDGRSPPLFILVVAAMVFALQVAVLWRRAARPAPTGEATLWTGPVLLMIGAGALFGFVPPSGWALLSCPLAAVVGGTIGWRWGRGVRIAGEPKALAIGFFVLLAAARVGARLISSRDDLPGLSWVMASETALSFAVGLYLARAMALAERTA